MPVTAVSTARVSRAAVAGPPSLLLFPRSVSAGGATTSAVGSGVSASVGVLVSGARVGAVVCGVAVGVEVGGVSRATIGVQGLSLIEASTTSDVWVSGGQVTGVGCGGGDGSTVQVTGGPPARIRMALVGGSM